ncbi:MAG TPA: lysophospholipid acyltransferase family protein [Spirochaetota bacterium]|nr:lysophospholipid acyltransferase family protein [Spirochaetota bacterium]HQH95561.1 lysophospholipid acyltransferase family protein [Spirochaetota bacterium]HQJ69139.1 lysophospholipid acyltransferase family protein [Spirochaetota bacterium]
MSVLAGIIKAPVDIIVTLICWLYFLLGYILFYIPILLLLSPFTSEREALFERINNVFYKVFFLLLATITPGLTIDIAKDVFHIKSAVVVANHRSYLDPILLISLFPAHRTIVKGIFFKLPIMRWVMKSGGYIPYTQTGDSKDLMIEGIQSMSDFFQKGGVLFIFPEGHRSRDGKLGHFQKGAFSIAAKYQVPIEVLFISNTDRLFTPGKFFFNTCIKNRISVEILGRIEPEDGPHPQARILRDKAMQLYHEKMGSIRS